MKRSKSFAIHIGTSGWHYKHWVGRFYPEKFPPSRMLDFYTKQFDTVEINSSFYRLPTVNGVECWRESTPANFVFSAKGSRFLTHMKKLKDAETGLERYFERIDPLGRKLECIVFQLPPQWECNASRLEAFLEALPRGRRYAFELRNASWHTAEINRLLRRHNTAFCIFEIGGFHSPCDITADFTYIRLHGPGAAYQGSYSGDALRRWSERLAGWQQDLRAAYVYFDNDQAAYATEDALRLKQLVRGWAQAHAA